MSIWAGILLLALFGAPAVAPIWLGVWSISAVGDGGRARLHLVALAGYPIAFTSLWWLTEFVNDNRASFNVPVILSALALAAFTTGVIIGQFWPSGGWIRRGALVLLGIADLLASGFVVVVSLLFLGGVQ